MPEDNKYKKLSRRDKKDLKRQINVESGQKSNNPNEKSFKNKDGIVSRDFSENPTVAKFKDVLHKVAYKAGAVKNKYRLTKVGKGNLPPAAKPPKTPPIDKPEMKPLESVESLSRNFISDPSQKTDKATPESKVIQTKGYDVSAKTPEGLTSKIDDALTKTTIGKDITKQDKEFRDAPEFARNKRIAANNAKRQADYLAKKNAAAALKAKNARKPGDRTEEVKAYRSGISTDTTLEYGSKYKKVRKKQLRNK